MTQLNSAVPGAYTEPAEHPVLSGCDLADLARGSQRAEELIATLKIDIAAINTEIARRFSEQIENSMAAKCKMSTTLDVEGGFKVKGSVSKTVTWDNDALQKIATGMGWDQVKHYFKIKFTVPEAIYNAVDPCADYVVGHGDDEASANLKAAMTTARTTKYGDLKVELIAPAE